MAVATSIRIRETFMISDEYKTGAGKLWSRTGYVSYPHPKFDGVDGLFALFIAAIIGLLWILPGPFFSDEMIIGGMLGWLLAGSRRR